MRPHTILAALLVCLAAGAARASTITHSFQFHDFDQHGSDGFESLSVPKFDPHLGTLNQVRMFARGVGAFGSAAAHSIPLGPDRPPPSVRLETTFWIYPDAPGMAGVFPQPPGDIVGIVTASIDTFPFFGPLDVAARNYETFPWISTTPEAYVGGDLLTFSLLEHATNFHEQDNGARLDGYELALQTIFTVEYDYSPIPEPAAASLLALPLLLLFLLRPKRDHHRRIGLEIRAAD